MARQPVRDFDIARVVGPDQTRARARERRRGGVWVWFAAIVVVAVLAVALHQWRNQVMNLFPWSVPAYVAVGLIAPPDSSGLRLDDVAFEVEEDGDERVLVVTGQVVNDGADVKQLPRLRGELLDAEGQVVTFWEFPASRRVLGPGERTSFRNTYPNPPVTGSATDLFVTFADLR
jgi:hypothetical protein